MLPAAHRVTDASSFREAARRGRRASTRTLVVHVLFTPAPDDDRTGSDEAHPARPPRAGFVVSKAVGNAVVRNRVKRRLRHLVRPHLADLPPGSALVVRALPAAAGATSATLGRDLSSCLRRCEVGS